MFTKFNSFKTSKLFTNSKLKTCTPPHSVLKNYAQAAPAPEQSILQKIMLFQYKNSPMEQFLAPKKEKAVHLARELVHMIVHSTKSAFRDMKYVAKIKSSKQAAEYSVQELREVNRIASDLTKFLPVYASLIIPAGELALFPYLYLFPRALPSYLVSEKSAENAKQKYLNKQEEAHKELKQYLLEILTRVAEEKGETFPNNIEEFFLTHKEAILPLLEAKLMDSETLKNASDFLMFEYVEGTYILNKLYKPFASLSKSCQDLFMWAAKDSYKPTWEDTMVEAHIMNKKFTMNSSSFEPLKKQLLKYQFNKQLRTMKTQNMALASGLFGDLKNTEMNMIARERGFNGENEEEAQQWLKESWNPRIQKHINEEMYTFWYSVVLYDSPLSQ